MQTKNVNVFNSGHIARNLNHGLKFVLSPEPQDKRSVHNPMWEMYMEIPLYQASLLSLEKIFKI